MTGASYPLTILCIWPQKSPQAVGAVYLPCASKNSSSEPSSESLAMLCILHSEMLCLEGLAERQNPCVTVWPAEKTVEPVIAGGDCDGGL